MRTLIILLLLCGTAWGKEDCGEPTLAFNMDYYQWREACREANALEDIAAALKRIAGGTDRDSDGWIDDGERLEEEQGDAHAL